MLLVDEFSTPLLVTIHLLILYNKARLLSLTLFSVARDMY